MTDGGQAPTPSPAGGTTAAGGAPGADGAASRAHLVAVLVAAWVTIAAFAPAVRDSLLQWDDVANLVDNTRYRGFSAETVKWAFTTTHLGPYQPLSWLSFTLDDAIWRGDPRGFYVTNVLLQGICAALLAALSWRLLPFALPSLGDRPALRGALSAFAALLWSVHPQRVESVAWATERRDVLSGAFLLAAALAWVVYAAPDRAAGASWWRARGWWIAFVLFVCSLLSKATGMGFVLVLLLLDWYPLARPFRGNLAEKVPFALAGAAAAVVAWIGQAGSGATVELDAVPFLGRAVIAGYSTTHYLVATVWPDGMRAHYQRPGPDEFGRPDLLAGFAAAIVLLNVVAFLRHRMRGVAVALGTYAVLLAPVSGLTLTGSHLVADRYSHQPTMALGIVVAAGLGFLLVSPRPRVAPGLLLAVAGTITILLATQTFRVAATWRTVGSLWGRVLQFEPRNWVAHEQLAVEAFKQKDMELAAAHMKVSLDSLPDRTVGSVLLASCLVETGDLAEAERRIDGVMKNDPGYAPAWRIRGRIRAARRDVDGAVAAYEQAVRLDPKLVPAIQDLAELLSRSRDAEAAEPWARRLVELNPNDVGARSFLGTVLQKRGDSAGAEALFREAAAIDPSAALPRMCLADLYGAAGDLTAAEKELRTVVALDPAHAEALGKLTAVLAIREAFDEAAEFAVRAADAAPADAAARLACADILARARRNSDARAAAQRAITLAEAAGDAATARRARNLLSRLPQ